MTMFVARYDLRCPPIASTTREELYASAIAQAGYCDTFGFDTLVLSEHHGVDDGYLPSPLVMASAFAAITPRIAITISALLAPLYDPLRLAEDIAVLDHASRGRVSYVMGLGYREEEYEALGKSWEGRGQLIEDVLATLIKAWTGEPFEYAGRTVRVTPTPFTKPHPMIFYGGMSKAAARRAARLGLGFFPQVTDTSLAELYRAECEKLGRRSGFVLQPPPGPGTVYCAENPDAFWERAGPHLLYEARSYHSWQKGVTSAVHDSSETVDEMKAAGVYAVWTPEEMIERCRSGEVGAVTTHPLCGGMPIDLSYESLRLIAETVIPAVRS
jgi:alkanesulfonate monooxygenase SsuD/methylene tetrahydromethanopterin reductase-like flavin-dependent oxidoreductase (luciferase family)